MSLLSTRFSAMLLLVALIAFPAWAVNETATINAFEALLSLPQTHPDEGEWSHVAPEGFDSEDEAGLIRWLTQQKKAGADFNQTRHQGTLLHHAIRGGLDATARWLISNGADPLKQLDGGPEQPDALALSIQYRRWSVLDALLKLPKVTAAERAPQLLTAWRSAQGKEDQAVVAKLLARRLPLPRGEAGEQLRAYALDQHWMTLVLALTDAGSPSVPAGGSNHGPTSPGIGGIAAADIETVDARLSSPIFPSLLTLVANTGDVNILWKLRIRHPFDDIAFTRLVVLRTIEAMSPPSVKRAVLERLPRNALKAALEDKEIFGPWVRWSAQLPAADGEWALAILGDMPTRRPAALLDAMVQNAGWYYEHEANPNLNLAAGWGRLLSRLHGPLPDDVNGKLWMFVPQQHRPTLLRLGYRPSDQELTDWLDRNDKDVIHAFWPQLKAAMPELVGRIHELLFPSYNETGYACFWDGIRPEVLEKARILLEAGAKPRKPLAIYAECQKEMEPAILQPLQAAGLFKLAAAIQPNRFVRDTTACRFHPNEIWRRALIEQSALGEVDIDNVQAIAMPGEAECALLVWGGNAGGRMSFDEDSFTGMQHFSPCADGHYASAVWRIVGKNLQQSQLGEDQPAIEGVLSLRDTHTDQHFLLAGGIGLGGCGQTPNVLLAWEKTRSTTALRVLPGKHATMQAFLQQCRPSDGWNCFGIDPTEHYSDYLLENFVDTQWATERKAYLDAVLALDYEALRTMQKTGIFPHWTTQAINAVTQANLPVEDKRRRIAWLFRDATLLKRALLGGGFSSEVQSGLVTWLPREDWLPLIKALKDRNGNLESLRSEADRQGKKLLSCRFSTALQRVCSNAER